MVPHMKVEEEIQALLDAQHTCVVTSVPDERAASGSSPSTPTRVAPHDCGSVCAARAAAALAAQARGSALVEAIPTLGTGKVDLRAVRQLAAGNAQGSGGVTMEGSPPWSSVCSSRRASLWCSDSCRRPDLRTPESAGARDRGPA
jgi:hypothetical protein